MVKMRGKVLEAFRKAGVEIPKSVKPGNGQPEKQKQHKSAKPKPTAEKIYRPKSRNTPKKGTVKKKIYEPKKTPLDGVVTYGETTGTKIIRTKAKQKPEKSKRPATMTSGTNAGGNEKIPFNQQFSLGLSESSEPQWEYKSSSNHSGFLAIALNPLIKLATTDIADHELTIGLDFGTSSVKVVIGDNILEKAYAVPFYEPLTSESYWLPTRLFVDNSAGSFENGAVQYQDLKLELMTNPSNMENQARIVLFLGMVIRHSINWLLENHSSTYGALNILWNISIGYPSIHIDFSERNSNSKADIYKKLASASWILATKFQVMDIPAATKCLSNMADSEPSDVEIEAIPEISAQIFGYINSDGFDPHGQKAFLLADIGAGTVDAALFRATKPKGRTNYEFYTTTVELLGVINLHDRRMDWLEKALSVSKDCPEELLASVKMALLHKSTLTRIPELLADYITEMEITFNGDIYNPDFHHFSEVRHQICTSTYLQAWKDGYWTQNELKDIPFYLCGGGARMDFFRKLEIVLSKPNPNMTWFRASPRKLTVPNILEAPGLLEVDFDRLSVAFGLSFDNIGDIKKIPPQKKTEPSKKSWQDNFVGPELC
jgi:hypothetical protein